MLSVKRSRGTGSGVLSRKIASSRLQKGLSRFSVSDLFWLFAFNLLAFQIYLQEEIGSVFNYLDELTSLLVLFVTAVTLLFRLNDKEERPRGLAFALVLLLCGITCGVVSNALNGFDIQTRAILTDIFTFCKFPLVIMCCAIFPKSQNASHSFWRLLVVESQILIAVMVVCAGLNILFYGHFLDMGGGFRYGISSFKFIFYHPEVVNLFTLGLIAILLIDKPNGHRIMILLGLLVMCLTLRSKAMGFSAAVLIILLTMSKGRITPAQLFIGLIFTVFVASDQFSNYYESGASARSLLTEDGFAVAQDYFPLGSGFATFGAAVTGTEGNYSPLYYQFGYNNVWGLAPGFTFFISDTFWPTVVAQLGFLGAVCYIAAVSMIIKLIYSRYKEYGRNATIIIVLLYLVICTTATSAIFAPQWTYLAFVFYLGMKHLATSESVSFVRESNQETNQIRVDRERPKLRKRGKHSA